MRKSPTRTAGAGHPDPGKVLAPESLTRVLLAATSRALRGADCGDLGRRPALTRLHTAPERVRRTALSRAATRLALPVATAGTVDSEQVARWIADHYPGPYPGVVIGAAHGAAVHLATALGVPWLPAGFDLLAQWPDGAVDRPAAACGHGGRIAAALRAGNPGVRVHQSHDPAGAGGLAGLTVSLTVRWERLPGAYRGFLAHRLRPGASVLLLRDTRPWPSLRVADGHTFAVGGPATGLRPEDFRPGAEVLAEVLSLAGGDPNRWEPPAAGDSAADTADVTPGFEAELRGWAEAAGSAVHRMDFDSSGALSAVAADVYRRWLRAAGKTGDRCVVECGRLVDPWQVVRAGLVPYWCESATSACVAGAEWWLAGSETFSSVDVLPEPPGLRSPALAGLPQWLAVASFGRHRRYLDRTAARGWPVNSVPTRQVTEVLRGHARDLPPPPPLRTGEVLAGLERGGAPAGLTVC